MLRIIDNFLNKITMYRLVLYFLISLLLIAGVLGFFGLLPHSPLMLLLSTIILIFVCYAVNLLFARVFGAHTNVESVYITALILALIITPPEHYNDTSYLLFIFWAAVWAMASKYILAIGKKHIFNPAAFGVALTALTINQAASWWVGTIYLVPFVFLGGFLIIRKIRRFDFIITFMAVAVLGIVILHANNLGDALTVARKALLSSPLLFFASIMLSEPLTTPPTRYLRMGYGALVGAIFDPTIHLLGFYSTPELALLVGNIFSYIVSPKKKLMLQLKNKLQIARDTYEFSFALKDNFNFRPGQYLEWTLGHKNSDSRGNRRYFTIASSPAEENLRIGVKFYPKPSSFKTALLNMGPSDTIVASQLAGEFTLPNNLDTKLCFMAGGIGVTPFESMLNYLLEQKQKRDIVVFYAVATKDDIAYQETLKRAEEELGVKTIYVISEFINEDKIKAGMPDYSERLYYISGSHAMVTTYQDILSSLGIPRSKIKVDFFPGYA